MWTALQAPEDALDAQEQKFVALIRQHGWFRTSVFADEAGPNFSYTTGFWVTLGIPEVIIFGLKWESAHNIFWGIVQDAKAGKDLPVLTRCADVLRDFDTYLFPVDQSKYADYLGWSRWFYRGQDFPCSQLVWPDREGWFPWDPDFDPELIGIQTDIAEGTWATRSS